LNRIVGETYAVPVLLPEGAAFSPIQEFETGAYTITIPTGYTTATVEVWGAGGGLGKYISDTTGSSSSRRGNGAYLTGILAVAPGDILTIQVGGGGGGGKFNSGGLGGSGGGGRGSGGDGPPSFYGGGGGGGYSSISKNTIPCLIAAGGGGGGRTKRGGNGGHLNAYGSPLVANGYPGGTDSSAGGGGTTSGGIPGTDGGSESGTAGSSGMGGNGGGLFAGGGGGGYFGGGGGWSENDGQGQGGGGGGSSYIDNTLVSSPIFSQALGKYGHGGQTTGAAGEPGHIIIVFS